MERGLPDLSSTMRSKPDEATIKERSSISKRQAHRTPASPFLASLPFPTLPTQATYLSTLPPPTWAAFLSRAAEAAS